MKIMGLQTPMLVDAVVRSAETTWTGWAVLHPVRMDRKLEAAITITAVIICIISTTTGLPYPVVVPVEATAVTSEATIPVGPPTIYLFFPNEIEKSS